MRKPTDKQIQALRKFKIPESEILRYSFEQASAKLDLLIKAAKEHDANSGSGSGDSNHPNVETSSPSNQTIEKLKKELVDEKVDQAAIRANIESNLDYALGLVCHDLGVERSKLTENQLLLVHECLRQLYGSQWLEKPMR